MLMCISTPAQKGTMGMSRMYALVAAIWLCQINSKQLLLWMMLPDYAPYDGEFEKFKDIEPVWSKHINVLISDTAYTTDLNCRYNERRNGPLSLFSPEGVEDLYELHRT